MLHFENKLRVRYAETDRMGYVYYGNYATYFEVARVESFRQIGFSYKELEESGILMPVLEYKTKYLKPAKYDDLLTIKVRITEKPEVRIKFDYEVYNEIGALLTIAETVLVFVNKESGKPSLPTPDFMNYFEKFYTQAQNSISTDHEVVSTIETNSSKKVEPQAPAIQNDRPTATEVVTSGSPVFRVQIAAIKAVAVITLLLK